MTVTELRNRRAELVRKAGEIITGAESEERGMTADEETRFKSLHAEADSLSARIELSEQHERMNGPSPVDMRDRPGIDPEQAVLDADQSVREWSLARRGIAERDDPGHGLTLGSFCRAMVCGPQNDTERRALSAGSDSAGGYTVPTNLSTRIIDNLRAQAVTIRAGARTVPVTTDATTLAKITADATVGWHTENASVTASDLTFAGTTFAPKTLIALVRASRELIEDSVNLDEALRLSFTGALSTELDNAALHGDGTGGAPTGVINIVGHGNVDMGTNGLAISDYDPILDALYEVEVDNAGPVTAAIMHPRTDTAIAKLKTGISSDNTPLSKPPKIANLPFLVTTAVPIDDTKGTSTDASRIIVGNFPNLWFGVRTELRIGILRERFADNFQYGFLAYLRADVQVAHIESFAEVEGIIP